MSGIDHGTRRGFQQHKALRGMPCAACEQANRDYMRQFMSARYDPARRRAQYERAKARGYYLPAGEPK